VPYTAGSTAQRSPQTIGIIKELKQRSSLTQTTSTPVLRKSLPASALMKNVEPIIIQRSRRSGRIQILTPDDAEITITVEPPPKPKSRPPPIPYDLDMPIVKQRANTDSGVPPPRPRTPAPTLDRAKYAVRVSITSKSPVIEEEVSNSEDTGYNTDDRMSVSVQWSPIHDEDIVGEHPVTIQINSVVKQQKKKNFKTSLKRFVDKLLNKKKQ